MKIGTIGTGRIVEEFLSAVEMIDGAECTAVYSRKKSTAEPLAQKFNVKTIHTDLTQLYNDPNVEVIYIASPNSLHFEQSYEALSHGKHVICEKPFTSTTEETERLIHLAEEKSLMLFEAIKNIHLPNYQLIGEHIHRIGKVKFIQCNYSKYSSRYDALLKGETPNVFNLEFAGGALADLNIYNLHFLVGLCGLPKNIHYTANKHPNGIDTSGIVVMEYPDYITECVAGKDAHSLSFVLLQGESGYIYVKNDANGCDEIIVHTKDKDYHLNNQTVDNHLYFETKVFKEIIEQNDFDRCRALLNHSREVMKVYEEARHSADIIFPADHKK